MNPKTLHHYAQSVYTKTKNMYLFDTFREIFLNLDFTFPSFSKALNLIGLEISVKIIYFVIISCFIQFCGCFYHQPSQLTNIISFFNFFLLLTIFFHKISISIKRSGFLFKSPRMHYVQSASILSHLSLIVLVISFNLNAQKMLNDKNMYLNNLDTYNIITLKSLCLIITQSCCDKFYCMFVSGLAWLTRKSLDPFSQIL